VSIHDDPGTPGQAPSSDLNNFGRAGRYRGTNVLTGKWCGVLPDDFDQIAVVVDWLDACRKRDLEALLELYAEGASVECHCSGVQRHQGRAALAAFWRPQFQVFVPTAFGLEEIAPAAGGVTLDYLNFEGKLVRVFFTFTAEGKIWQTRCVPPGAADDTATAQHPSG
jgi:SnoaL-like domain